jgi:hypothetical protein
MDCRNARLLFDFARPQSTELEVSAWEELETHLVDCPECGALARTERRIDALFGRAMRNVPVPDELRDRLRQRLTAEHDAWYGRWLLRAVGVAAAAALVFLICGRFWRNGPEDLDPDRIVDARIIGAGEPASTSPEAVETWFKEHYGITTHAPREVNYTYFTHCSLAEYRGKKVPVLAFADNGQRARVYIVTDTQFEGLVKLADEREPRGSQGFEVRVKASDNPHVYYIRVYHKGIERKVFPSQNAGRA